MDGPAGADEVMAGIFLRYQYCLLVCETENMCIIREMAMDEALRFRTRIEEREREPWAKDHDDAMQAYASEFDIEIASAVYKLIENADETWRDNVGSGKDQYSVEDHGNIKTAYRMWLSAAETIQVRANRLSSLGYEINGLAVFQSMVREAKGILTPDDKFFGEGLVNMRDEAIDSHARGETCEFRPAEC